MKKNVFMKNAFFFLSKTSKENNFHFNFDLRIKLYEEEM